MNQEDIIRMAREAGLHVPYWADEEDPKKDPPRWTMVSPLPPLLERFAALVTAAEREKVSAWMMAKGYATGHGDTTEDLLKEIEWQIRERERQACAKVVEQYTGAWSDEGYALATAIRARGTQGKSQDDWRPDPDLA